MKEFVFEKREYQEAAVAETVQAFNDGCNSVLIESPVGSGKTIMGLMVASELVKKSPDLKINWVASRRHILNQTQRINSQYFHLRLNLVSVFDKEPPECDLCIIDEAHHEATNSCIRMYARCKNTYTLGLSATPQRTDRMKLSFKRPCTAVLFQCSLRILYWYLSTHTKYHITIRYPLLRFMQQAKSVLASRWHFLKPSENADSLQNS